MTLYRFVDTQGAEGFPVRMACSVVGVSASAYYAYRKRPQPGPAQLAEDALVDEIRAIWAESGGTYGSPRVCAELRRRGRVVNHKRVERLMKCHHMAGFVPRKRRVTTTADSTHRLPDLLRGDFAASEPDVAWVGDISYIRTRQGFLYLAFVLDLASRRVVGVSMAPHLKASLATDALREAIATRGGRVRGVVFHNDPLNLVNIRLGPPPNCAGRMASHSRWAGPGRFTLPVPRHPVGPNLRPSRRSKRRTPTHPRRGTRNRPHHRTKRQPNSRPRNQTRRHRNQRRHPPPQMARPPHRRRPTRRRHHHHRKTRLPTTRRHRHHPRRPTNSLTPQPSQTRRPQHPDTAKPGHHHSPANPVRFNEAGAKPSSACSRSEVTTQGIEGDSVLSCADAERPGYLFTRFRSGVRYRPAARGKQTFGDEEHCRTTPIATTRPLSAGGRSRQWATERPAAGAGYGGPIH